jgi:hypothetical protein
MNRGGSVPETLTHAIARLHACGYDHDFIAETGGLRDRETGALFAPEDMLVDEIVRFEGITDPGDEAIVCALRDIGCTVRGTLSTAYGAAMESAEVDMLQRLPSGH